MPEITTEEAMRIYMQTWVEAQGLLPPATEAELLSLFSMLPMPPVSFVDWCKRMGLAEAAAPVLEQAMLAANDVAAATQPGM